MELKTSVYLVVLMTSMLLRPGSSHDRHERRRMAKQGFEQEEKIARRKSYESKLDGGDSSYNRAFAGRHSTGEENIRAETGDKQTSYTGGENKHLADSWGKESSDPRATVDREDTANDGYSLWSTFSHRLWLDEGRGKVTQKHVKFRHGKMVEDIGFDKPHGPDPRFIRFENEGDDEGSNGEVEEETVNREPERSGSNSDDSTDDDDSLFLDWDDEDTIEKDISKKEKNCFILEILHAAFNSGSKVIEFSTETLYVCHAVVAVVVVLWLVNALLFVGLWRVPKLHSTMKIKPSLGGKSKRSGSAKHATDGNRPRSRRHKHEEPRQSDSTIATVTVLIGGGGGGEGVKVVHNSKTATVATAAVDGTDPDSFEESYPQHKSRSRQRQDYVLGDTDSRAPKISRTKRKSKERYSSTKSRDRSNGSAVSVYDLNNPNDLPPEILDLLSCRGGELCFHNHDRCRVVNNKLYICTKRNRSSSRHSKRRTSPPRQSPPRQRRTKRVTFSPVEQTLSPKKRGSSGRKLISPGPVSNQEEEQWMPPPPHGYHIRIDPSSPEAYNEVADVDESTWTQTEDATIREVSNNHSVSSRALDRSSPSRSNQKGHFPIKEIKERFKKTMVTSPQRFTRSVRSKTKKPSSGRMSPTRHADRKLKCQENERDGFGYGALGDFGPSQIAVQRLNKNFIQKIDDRGYACCENNSNYVEVVSSMCKVNSEATRISPNRPRQRHTLRDRGEINHNNNSNRDSIAPATSTCQCFSTGSTPVIVSNISYCSRIFRLHHLNINMNNFPGDDSGQDDVPGEHQEVTSEQNASSSPTSVDQFYTPEPSSPGGAPGAASETTAENCSAGQHLEAAPRCTQKTPLTSPTSVGDKPQEQEKLVESDQECWEAKKHSIMMACNEAIKNRLQKQELEEGETREMTSSESSSARRSCKAKKKRKTKTTESVYVKFKTSLSKKMTTTTTLKEVKQSAYDIPAKNLMVENDRQNVLSLTTQSSEQSLSVPQPRHTRIVKCGELESSNRKRRQSSDTEVELLHSGDPNKPHSGVSKSVKDNAMRDRQISKKENTYVETSLVEEHSVDVDRQDVSQPSPHQNPSVGHGEMIGEYDKLSEKASAITVINVMETPDCEVKPDKIQGSEAAEPEESESVPVEGQELASTTSYSLSGQSESVTLQSSIGKEHVKKKNKSQSSRQKGKKKSDPKRVSSKSRDTVDSQAKCETPKGPLSETSLSQTSKKSAHSSHSKALQQAARSHSSPPEGRSKKSKKKTPSVHLLDPSEGSSRQSHKVSKKTTDRKKKLRPSSQRDEKSATETGGSTSSVNSERKRKSQTTASSISIDSEEEDQKHMEKVSPEIDKIFPETEVGLARLQIDEPERSKVYESSQVSTGQKDSVRETSNNKVSRQSIASKNKIEGTLDEEKDNSEDRALEPIQQTNVECVLRLKLDSQSSVANEDNLTQSKTSKLSTKVTNARTFPRNQSKEKDLQKAEMGWNNSIFYPEEKTKGASTRARTATRRPKLKYVLVKAKDKAKGKGAVKVSEAVPQPISSINQSPPGATSDQDMKQDGQGDSSLRAKTVQFSESIEKIENMKEADILEEAESLEGQAQETHIGDNASDGSLGDVFLSNNFDLVRELVEEVAECKQEQPEQASGTEPQKQKSSSPKRHRRPVWLKKAAAPKLPEEPITVETRFVTSKQNLSPKRLEKRKDSLEEILRTKKCNIQVTNPLPPSGISPKGEQASLKTKVAYSSMLSNVFQSLPLKKGARRVIAESGSPVDIKEVIEGSSVDAADYAKNLRYSPKPRRSAAAAPAGAGRGKKGQLEPRSRSPREMLIESGSFRSLVSRDSDGETRLTTPNGSFSTDLDEAAVFRPGHSSPTGRGMRAARKKEKRTASSSRRAESVVPWQILEDDLDLHQDEDQDPLGMSYVQFGIFNVGLSWLMREFFRRFDFLNPRRNLMPVYHRQASELSLDPPGQEQEIGAV